MGKTSMYVLSALGLAATVGIIGTYTSGPQSGLSFMQVDRVFEGEFQDFVRRHGRRYASKEEYEFRFGIFQENLAIAEQKNADTSSSATYGVTSLSDFTDYEYKQLLGFKSDMVARKPPHTDDLTGVPSSINWVDKGAVTPIKNQGQCGSCWSFSTTGSLEGCNFIKSGKLYNLSEQQLVDCSTYNNGCYGGNFDIAFMYTESTDLDAESEYPYLGYQQ